MNVRLFTVVSEFRGTTDVSQVSAADERDAVQEWANKLRAERLFERISPYLATVVESEVDEFPPVAIRGVANVWCITATCGGDLMLANFVDTVWSANGS